MSENDKNTNVVSRRELTDTDNFDATPALVRARPRLRPRKRCRPRSFLASLQKSKTTGMNDMEGGGGGDRKPGLRNKLI